VTARCSLNLVCGQGMYGNLRKDYLKEEKLNASCSFVFTTEKTEEILPVVSISGKGILIYFIQLILTRSVHQKEVQFALASA